MVTATSAMVHMGAGPETMPVTPTLTAITRHRARAWGESVCAASTAPRDCCTLTVFVPGVPVPAARATMTAGPLDITITVISCVAWAVVISCVAWAVVAAVVPVPAARDAVLRRRIVSQRFSGQTTFRTGPRWREVDRLRECSCRCRTCRLLSGQVRSFRGYNRGARRCPLSRCGIETAAEPGPAPLPWHFSGELIAVVTDRSLKCFFYWHI